jgi:molybdopterin converting factor subunit 1
VRILYFAWLKARTGCAEEDVTLPEGVDTVAALMDWLKSRGEGYAEALANPALVRVAVNQEFATPGDAVGPDDEVALFPPVTGG